jgi:hypothetical protein
VRHVLLAIACALAVAGAAAAQDGKTEGNQSGSVLPPPSYPKILPFTSPINGKITDSEEADAFYAVVRAYQAMKELECGDDKESAAKYDRAREDYYDALRKYVDAFSPNAEEGKQSGKMAAQKALADDFAHTEDAVHKTAKPIVCPAKPKRTPKFLSPFGTEDFDGYEKQDFAELVSLYEIKLIVARCGPGAVKEDPEFPRPSYEAQLRAYILAWSGLQSYHDVRNPETDPHTREKWEKDKALVEDAVKKAAKPPSCPGHRRSSKKHGRRGKHGVVDESSPFYMENYPTPSSPQGTSPQGSDGSGWTPVEPTPETGDEGRKAPTEGLPQPPDRMPAPP